MSSIKSIVLAILIVGGAACGQRSDETSRDTGAGRTSDTSMADMPGMRSGGAESGTAQTMAAMEDHLRSIENATPEEQRTMLPLHRPTVANMIAQVDREMRDMNMPADAAWNAVLDSLRQDLRVMPELGTQALHGMMPEHARRVRRVIEMHRAMMAKTGH